MQKRKIHRLFLLLLLLTVAAGCGQEKKKITDGSEIYVKRQEEDSQEETEEEIQIPEILYAVTGIDTEHQLLTLRDCETGREKPYSYTGGTYIRNKYGDSLAIGQLSQGDLVTVEEEDEKLTAVQISKDAFTYDDLYNFTLDKEQNSLTVGKESYYFDENLLVLHGQSKISVSEISEHDNICMKGVGQHIYVIQVDAGHGTVVLENTDLFQGGYITIGNILSKKITPQMRIEVPEGTYLLAVANNGYGGSRNITVEANREVKVNLDELKGEGPKQCQIKFKVTPEQAVVQLDGQPVDISQPIQVSYGVHQLTAKAEGYADWKRTLIVNSSEAELPIKMTSKEEDKKDETISTSGSSQASGSTNNNTSGSKGTNTNNNRTNTPGSSTNNNRNNTLNNNNSNNNNSNRNNTNNNNSNNNNNNSNNSNNNNSNNNNNNNNSNSNNNNSGNNNSNNNNNSSNNNNNSSNNNSNSNNNSSNNNSNSNNNNSSNNNSNNNNDNTGSGRIDGGLD